MYLIPIIIFLAFIAIVAILALKKIKHCFRRSAKIPAIKPAVLFLFLVAAMQAQAADQTALYKAGEFQVQPLAFTDTEDFKDFDSGGGIAAAYWATENFGLGFEAKTKDTRHAFFDALGLNLQGRIPLEKSLAPFAKVGFDWNAEQVNNARANGFDLYVGAGIEKRFSHGISAGLEARIIRDYELKADERYQFLVFVGKSF